jgi:CRP-like cAMP-binding protein
VLTGVDDDRDWVAGNRLLDALPDADRSRVGSLLANATADRDDTLIEPGQPIEHVWFPLDLVVSIVLPLPQGEVVELATVGNEGMVGVAVFLGATSTESRSFPQAGGRVLRMPAADFRREVGADGALRVLVQRYTSAFVVQLARQVACNRLHSIEERTCRWLLTTHDRVGSDRLLLTQEYLAQMLGVRRASVNVVAGFLQQAGFITYRRGAITIVDRGGLENSACECYRVIREQYDQVVSEPTPASADVTG